MVGKVIVYKQVCTQAGDEVRVLFQCPGCDNLHCVRITAATDKPNQSVWGFNGDMDKPTFTPSVLTNGHDPATRCHIFVKDGMIQYLGDCWHDLKNTTIPMVDIPMDLS